MRWFSKMTQSAVRKFHFGDDFDEERRGGVVRRAQDRAALDEAEQRGYAAGFQAGMNEQAQTDHARLALAIEALAQHIQKVEEDTRRFLAECEEQSVHLACDLASLHGDIVQGFDPYAGFTAALRDVFTQFSTAPYLIARVPLARREEAEKRLGAIAEACRFSGRLIVEPLQESVESTDFALEWPEGALRHDREALRLRLLQELERFGFQPKELMDHG